MAASETRVIRLAHSPDADDAFMFWALATGKIDTGERRYVQEFADIESLNRRALQGELEVTAVSLHAYAYLHDRYHVRFVPCMLCQHQPTVQLISTPRSA